MALISISFTYIGGQTKTGTLIVHDGSDVTTPCSSVLDKSDSIVPHRIGQVVQVLAESQTILRIRVKVARHNRVNEALSDVLVDQIMHLRQMSLERAEHGRAGRKVYFSREQKGEGALKREPTFPVRLDLYIRRTIPTHGIEVYSSLDERKIR